MSPRTPTAVMTKNVQSSPHDTSLAFGFEEMLTELEAIVAEAEIRLAEEEATA